MNKEKFLSFMKRLKKIDKYIDTILDLNIMSIDNPIIEEIYYLHELFIKENFDERGTDWIFWWLYERSSNEEEPQAFDENNNPIPTNTIEDLWNLVKDYVKEYESKEKDSAND